MMPNIFLAVLTDLVQLKDKTLFIEKSYINGEWVGAQSGETFDVHGKHSILQYWC